MVSHGQVLLLTFLSVLGVDFNTHLLPYLTIILSFAFVFGSSFNQAFNSFIFIFFGACGCCVISYPHGDSECV